MQSRLQHFSRISRPDLDRRAELSTSLHFSESFSSLHDGDGEVTADFIPVKK